MEDHIEVIKVTWKYMEDHMITLEDHIEVIKVYYITSKFDVRYTPMHTSHGSEP